MAKKTTLKAAPRLRSGSGQLKQMRREGWLPSVIYGRGVDNISLKVDAKTFSDLMAQSSSDSILINLDVEGEGIRSVFLKTVQYDPLSDQAIHADFLAVDDKTEITASIPVNLVGDAAGVKTGGILEQYHHSIEIVCFPQDLPDVFEKDISELDQGDSLLLSDLDFPEGVKSTQEDDLVIALIGRPAALVSAEAGAEGEAASEAAPAAAEPAAEGDSAEAAE